MSQTFCRCIQSTLRYSSVSFKAVTTSNAKVIDSAVACLTGYRYFSTTMNKLFAIKPPSSVKGMTKWNKSAFKQTFHVPCLVCPKESIDSARKMMQPFVVRVKRFSYIADLDSGDEKYSSHRVILLDPSKVSDMQSLPPEIVSKLADIGVKEDDVITKPVNIDHDNWTFSDIVRAIVPDDIEEPSSGYSEIGHIAHFNLREDMLPYKYVIGEALLEYSKRIKTVVNKTNTIDNTYRTFQLELIAGEENYITNIKENNCILEMDFSKVYWNSRLATEHSRVIYQTNHGDIVFDVFAGIGPFALPCAKRKCSVFGNDLNPMSYKYLEKNRLKNKISEDRLKAFCLDGRTFIQTVVKDELIKVYKEGSIHPDYKVLIVMNLPALAVTFTDAFQSLLQGENMTIETKHEPTVYCYCFTDINEAEMHWNGDMYKEIKQRVIKFLPLLSEDDISLRSVRDVAPNKDMVCINFTLRKDILLGTDILESESGEPPKKCRKTEDEKEEISN